METNPLTDYPGWASKDRAQKYLTISWAQLKSLLKSRTRNIKAERIRFVSDPGFPAWDCTYFIVSIDGVHHHVVGHPFGQVEKPFTRHFWPIVKSEGVYLPNLKDVISTSQ